MDINEKIAVAAIRLLKTATDDYDTRIWSVIKDNVLEDNYGVLRH